MKQETYDRKQFWLSNGTTVQAIKSLPRNPSAKSVKAVWDYKAKGLTIDEARKLIERHTTGTNPHGTGGWLRGTRKDRAEIKHDDGRYLMMMQKRRQGQKKLANYLADASAATWMEGQMDWQNTRLVLPLPDGGCVVTERHEDTTWSKNRHWPTSRNVSYLSTRFAASGDTVGNSFPHDRRNGWHGRVLLALGLIDPSVLANRRDMARRLNPTCEIRHEHRVGEYVLAHRCVADVFVDVVASDSEGTAFHEADAKSAIAGLRRKAALKSARPTGTVLSASIAHQKWGFCRQGLAEFAQATGLSINEEYTVNEVKDRLTDDIRHWFAKDLKTAGL
ncbi:MAG: hypothetical protein ACOYOU_02935 [Kiritimatiellia bacterium]